MCDFTSYSGNLLFTSKVGRNASQLNKCFCVTSASIHYSYSLAKLIGPELKMPLLCWVVWRALVWLNFDVYLPFNFKSLPRQSFALLPFSSATGLVTDWFTSFSLGYMVLLLLMSNFSVLVLPKENDNLWLRLKKFTTTTQWNCKDPPSKIFYSWTVAMKVYFHSCGFKYLLRSVNIKTLLTHKFHPTCH